MPRVVTENNSASERLVVAPGHEANAIFHMPTSQSGHPMSPYYMVGHEAWVKGEATPLLPGEALYSLYLQPISKQ
jgi:penicillin amidase